MFKLDMEIVQLRYYYFIFCRNEVGGVLTHH